MRVTMIFSASRGRQVHIMRQLDGRRRRIILAVGSRLSPGEIVEYAAPQLTDEELAEVRVALGLDPIPPEDVT